MNLAALYPEKKKGRSVVLSGFAFFTKLNLNLLEIGQPLITGVPQMGQPDTLVGFSVDVVTTVGQEDIKLNLPAPISPENKVVVYATPTMRQGNKGSKTRLRMIGVIDSTFITGGSIKDMYIARFGGMLLTGEKAQFEVKAVVITSGYASMKVTTTSVGTA